MIYRCLFSRLGLRVYTNTCLDKKQLDIRVVTIDGAVKGCLTLTNVVRTLRQLVLIVTTLQEKVHYFVLSIVCCTMERKIAYFIRNMFIGTK